MCRISLRNLRELAENSAELDSLISTNYLTIPNKTTYIRAVIKFLKDVRDEYAFDPESDTYLSTPDDVKIQIIETDITIRQFLHNHGRSGRSHPYIRTSSVLNCISHTLIKLKSLTEQIVVDAHPRLPLPGPMLDFSMNQLRI